MKSKYLFLILIVLSFFFSCSQEDELVIPEKPFENSALELEQAKLVGCPVRCTNFSSLS